MYLFYLSVLISVFVFLKSCKIENENNILEKDSTIGIRGITILFIVFHHVVQHTPACGILYRLGTIGYLGVAIFFLLSSYGNYFSFNKSENKIKPVKFILKRIIRIAVTFWIIWILDLIILYIVKEEYYSFEDIIKQGITLTFPYWINWYLKIQVLAYILFYISFTLFKNKNSEVLLILTIIVAVIFIVLKFDNYWWNTIICFGLGSLIAKYREKISEFIKSINKYKLISSLFIIFIIFYYAGTKVSCITLISSILFCIFIVVFLFYCKIKSKIFNFFGNISLELYLVHLVLLKLLFPDKQNIMNLDVNLFLFFGISIISAYGINKLIKKIL